MQTKLRPGDTFAHELDGTTYMVRVLSVGDQMEIDERLTALEEVKNNREHLQGWLDIVQKHVVGWDRDEPIDELRYHVDAETLSDLLGAVLSGNQVSEDERKN